MARVVFLSLVSRLKIKISLFFLLKKSCVIIKVFLSCHFNWEYMRAEHSGYDEITIDVAHNAKDLSWTQYEKCAVAL